MQSSDFVDNVIDMIHKVVDHTGVDIDHVQCVSICVARVLGVLYFGNDCSLTSCVEYCAGIYTKHTMAECFQNVITIMYGTGFNLNFASPPPEAVIGVGNSHVYAGICDDPRVPYKIVAVKVFDLGGGNTAVHFLQQVHAMSVLEGIQGIQPILSVWTSDDKGYIASKMYHTTFSTVQQRVCHQIIQASETWNIIAKLLRVLAEAHGRGVAHRDVKPANIMFDEQMNPVLIDWDAAWCNMDEAPGPCNYVATSVMYRAPEMFMERAQSTKVDSWSIGCVIGELVTGDCLFGSEDDDIKEAVTNPMTVLSRLEWIKQRAGHEFHLFVSKLLVQDPNHRWSCAQAFEHCQYGL